MLRELSQDLTELAAALATTLSGDVSIVDVLSHARELGELRELLIGAAVLHGRARRESMGPLARQVGLSEDRFRKKYRPADVRKALAARPRRRNVERPAVAAEEDPRHPQQCLARALSRLHRSSGLTQSRFADRVGLDPTYLSRLLSGKRPASWAHVRAIAQGVDHVPEALTPLLEVAAGAPPSSTFAPDDYLRRYLTSLHFACGTPSDAELLAAVQHPLSSHQLNRALHGPDVPDWPVIETLVTALGSFPEYARPLWRAARNAAIPGPRAEAFG